MGILSKNANIEDEQILYKDKDLTKFSDKQFTKIRGSEISMIFQDQIFIRPSNENWQTNYGSYASKRKH